MRSPKVSIIMPTYNTPYDFFESAVKSILSQSFSDFELIIIDDGSTQFNDFYKISEIIGNDDRVRLISNTNKKGVAGALNTGLINSTGEYIIRMDSDDIAEKTRIQKQVNVLEKNLNISLVAGFAKCFGSSNAWHKSPKNNTPIKTSLIFEPVIVHPTVCIRKSSLDKYNLQYKEDAQNEDYDLWTRCAIHEDFRFFTLTKKVLNYRVHPGQVTKTRIEKLKKQGIYLRKNYLSTLGVKLLASESESFACFTLGIPFEASPKQLLDLLKSIYSQAKVNCIFENKNEYSMTFWCFCCKKIVRLMFKGKMRYLPCLCSSFIEFLKGTFVLTRTKE